MVNLIDDPKYQKCYPNYEHYPFFGLREVHASASRTK